ncbi:MAG: hypothetical protein A3G41_08205 [Elusimicrobia bacterium RIFCSPLOWO2_12_FULL_59_9]|nr:MAG: hypothetical protein A3G41_08205 [Elusimicrobia bacterium RIFCSPLOWO2_12_FULL_59_9]
MKRVLVLLFLAGSIAFPGSVQARVLRGAPPSKAVGTRFAALSRLSRIVNYSLDTPGRPVLAPFLNSAVPKAAVLTGRAEGARGGEATPGDFPSGLKTSISVLRTFQALDSVLQDFTPETLQTMPVERLHALSALILEQLPGSRPAGTEDALEGVAALSEARVKSLLKRPGRRSMESAPSEPYLPRLIHYKGVPKEARVMPPVPRIFRHYGTKSGVSSILASLSLWNGHTPYVRAHGEGLLFDVFTDLTGVFLTLPGVSKASVGVGGQKFPVFVDLLLSPRLPILEIEPGRIFLIPLPARMPPDAGPKLRVPVEIVRHGRAR